MTDESTSAAGPLPASFRLDAAARQLWLDPRDASFFRNPYPAYAELHRTAPIVYWTQFGCLAIADHALISSVLRDRRFGRILTDDPAGRPDYRDRPGHVAHFYAIEANSLLDLEPPTHTRLRGLVNRAFVSRQIDRLAPKIEGLANSLIDGFVDKGAVDLVEAFASPLPVIVIAELLGIDPDRRDALLDWSHRMVAMYQFGRTHEMELAADRAAAEFADFMRQAIAHKSRAPGDDLISGLIAAETNGGRLNEAEMISTLILLMNAGHEATVHQIGNGVRAILGSGENPQALFADAASSALAVEEMLRFDTPLHMFQRIAMQDLELVPGVELARGDRVALLLGAGNRDPKVFKSPDRFDPRRQGAASVSFGAGIHFCIGAPLARLELGIAVRALFRRLDLLTLASRPVVRDTYHFRGLERLEVAFERGYG